MKHETEIRKYLETKVDPFLKPLLLDLMKARPDEVYHYLKNWVDTKGMEIHEKSKPQVEIEKSAHSENLKASLAQGDAQTTVETTEQIQTGEGTEGNKVSQIEELRQSLHKSLIKEHHQSLIEEQQHHQNVHQSHHQSVYQSQHQSVHQSHHEEAPKEQTQSLHQSHHQSFHQSQHQDVNQEPVNEEEKAIKQSHLKSIVNEEAVPIKNSVVEEKVHTVEEPNKNVSQSHHEQPAEN